LCYRVTSSLSLVLAHATLGVGQWACWIRACDASLVFERFTERARQVVVLAQEEARTLKHDYIGTEHILLGLLREEAGLAARVLESLDITAERVRGQVVRIVGSGDEVTSGQIPFTPRAKAIFELALREALSHGSNNIDTEHILLAIMRENEGVAARVLLDFDADPEKVRHAVIRMLSGPSGRRGGPGHQAGQVARRIHAPDFPRPALDWRRASMLWRPEGLELRIPLALNEGAIAAFAADEAWSSAPLTGIRREIWSGWVALASPSLLDEVDPVELRCALDGAAKRALDVSGRERGRIEDFLHRLREGQ
jgi:Clp amino terminal domain, pathogenicity island component